MTSTDCRIEGDTAYSDQLTSIYSAGMQRMGARLVNGELSIDDWHQQMKDAVDKMMTFQSMAGANGDPSQVDSAALTAAIQNQYGYLDGFASDIEQAMQDGGSLAFVPSRAAMYAGSSKQAYWDSATGYADLPAVPSQGSECRGNCGCYWECRDGEWYWVRGKDDSCPTCLAREAAWNPYIPGVSPEDINA